MDSVNKTLYIPLYGKAYVSRRNLILHDPSAESIWEAEGFPLKGKAKSKWLAYNMGMRSRVFDRWVQEKIAAFPEAAVLHLGCGLDSRMQRLNATHTLWFDVDFPEVITERRKYFPEGDSYRMIPSDIRDAAWMEQISADTAIVVMEGVSMYLTTEELTAFLETLSNHVSKIHLLMDSYTAFAAKATKYKNPINDVGVTQVFGFDDPAAILPKTGLRFVAEHPLTPEDLIRELPKREQGFFRLFFAGKTAKNLYRLYEYEKGAE